jgi:methionine-rich copper-binding protein CopC
MRRSIFSLGLICVANLFAAAAAAHAFLDHAIPPVGGTVSVPPKEIRLFFSEPIEPLFSTIALASAGGQPIETGPAAVAAADHRQFVLSLPVLTAGRYKVTWHVVSVDSHPTEGSFTFEIKQ